MSYIMNNLLALFKKLIMKDDYAELSKIAIMSAKKTGQLNLSSRGLSSVPDRVWSINELTEEELRTLHFELDYEHKDEHWWKQEELRTLRVLDLSCNRLTAIDEGIGNLTELNKLDVHNNLLEELPAMIHCLRKLKTLNFSDNKLEYLNPQLFLLMELRELYLKNNNIGLLYPEIGHLVMLTHLDLSYNTLTFLPFGMGYLVRLVMLDVSHNSIIELNPDIMSMRSLKILDVSFNDLNVIPPLGGLRKVEKLMFQSNNLVQFPDVSGCSALTELHLDNNSIFDIVPEFLGGVSQLKKLMLQNNKIVVIPETIIRLINLEVFDLSHNNISIIPSFIGIMPNLKQFVVEGNNITNIGGDIVRCDTSRILEHIRQTTDNTNVNTRDSLPCSASTSKYPDKYMMKNTKLLSSAERDLVELPEDVIADAVEGFINFIAHYPDHGWTNHNSPTF